MLCKSRASVHELSRLLGAASLHFIHLNLASDIAAFSRLFFELFSPTFLHALEKMHAQPLITASYVTRWLTCSIASGLVNDHDRRTYASLTSSHVLQQPDAGGVPPKHDPQSARKKHNQRHDIGREHTIVSQSGPLTFAIRSSSPCSSVKAVHKVRTCCPFA